MHEMTVNHLGRIGPEEKFYGYVVGLSLERGDLPGSPEVPARMFARFEYSGRTWVAEVPDFELFELLTAHLKANARWRHLVSRALPGGCRTGALGEVNDANHMAHEGGQLRVPGN